MSSSWSQDFALSCRENSLALFSSSHTTGLRGRCHACLHGDLFLPVEIRKSLGSGSLGNEGEGNKVSNPHGPEQNVLTHSDILDCLKNARCWRNIPRPLPLPTKCQSLWPKKLQSQDGAECRYICICHNISQKLQSVQCMWTWGP